MAYSISGLELEQFNPLFSLSDAALKARGIMRITVDAKPGYPCRITLEDADIGDTVLLLNHESHNTASPFRSSYAIYVNESAAQTRHMHDALPGVFENRTIALRVFDDEGMLIGADMGEGEALHTKIEMIFANSKAAYIHAHNAMHGCFAAEIRPVSPNKLNKT